MSESYAIILQKVTVIIKEVSQSPNELVITPDTNLFSERILDSVMLIDLLNKIETEFSVKVTTKEFIPENFSTIERLAQAIIRIKDEKK